MTKNIHIHLPVLLKKSVKVKDAFIVTPTQAKKDAARAKALATSSTWSEINSAITALAGSVNWGKRQGFPSDLLAELESALKYGKSVWESKGKTK